MSLRFLSTPPRFRLSKRLSTPLIKQLSHFRALLAAPSSLSMAPRDLPLMSRDEYADYPEIDMSSHCLLTSPLATRQEIPLLLNSRKLFGAGVEVGVQRGDYSKCILETWRGHKLYLVDLWRPMDDSLDPANVSLSQNRDNLAATFDAIAPFDPRAVIIREDSVGAARLFMDASLDFVYIDAGHTHHDASIDIHTWATKVRPGGLLMGHDYMSGEVSVLNHLGQEVSRFHIDVKTAVDDWAKRHSKQVHTTHEETFKTWIIEM